MLANDDGTSDKQSRQNYNRISVIDIKYQILIKYYRYDIYVWVKLDSVDSIIST